MYLQALEIIGFKSFANKTRLVFEPGITAIVGPNGCGKSNVSDAIRWVLGEQRPTALRGSAMIDVIFNGTENRKPLGMTEVSITFADCEEKLGTEYNEVTVTRRVFRSGEGQYFINKTPCRLRDIHRLFMGTGIGTTSYSIMAQGQIDAVLSSRPEDRRAIFEEASGITRFRADRREAMRKLEQTEANLLRLNDIIRELHRQIGSLQRQAGKARRYKELQADLRKYDIFVTTHKIVELNKKSETLDVEISALAQSTEALKEQVATGEDANAASREELMNVERQIGQAMEAAMQAQGRRNQAGEAIRMNEQRIAEYKEWSQRDEREINETKSIRATQEERIADCADQLEGLEIELQKAEESLALARTEFDVLRNRSETARNELQKLRNEMVEAERLHAQLQNELSTTENSARESLLKNERLASEKARLTHTVKELSSRIDELSGETETLHDMVDAHAEDVQNGERKIEKFRLALRDAQQTRADLQSQIAAQQARIQLLTDTRENANEIPMGSQLLLDPTNPLALAPDTVIGPLAEQFTAPKTHRAALEAVLRAWLDAVAVRSAADAGAIVDALLRTGKNAGTRLIPADANGASVARANLTLPRLIDHITYADAFAPAAEFLLANVFVVDTLADVPAPFPQGCAFVTLAGAVAFGGGVTELWMPEGGASNPFSRHALATDAQEELDKLELEKSKMDARVAESHAAIDAATAALNDARNRLDQSRRAAAQKEGEEKTLRRDFDESKKRLDAVTKELDALVAETESGNAKSRELTRRIREMADGRTRMSDAVAAQSDAVREAENDFLDAQSKLTEARLLQAHVNQRTESTRSQYNAGIARLSELDRMVQGRMSGLKSYEDAIAKLTKENESVAGVLEAMDADVAAKNADVAGLREERTKKQVALDQAERMLQNLRRELENSHAKYSRLEVSLAEVKMHRQNIHDRLMLDWHLAPEQLVSEPVPDWGDDGEPDIEFAETRAREIRAKMEEMGPVNLVAIEEYQEIEERHAFLTAQEADLVGAKAKLIELIKEIDKTSTELFRETFDKANENFQTMFTRLFNGGTAQLSLLDGEDILECGIEIVARPPGKKPQSISLLSGGERTMTAVALLFAIYMIKPSPFALLDELDAALDDSNIGRFVGVLKDFLELSQFLIITHNQHTIAGADIVYGVTQEDRGVSKIVSMRLKRVGVEELTPEELPEVNAPPPPSARKMKKYETKDEPETKDKTE